MNRSIKLALLAAALVMVAIAYSADPAPKAKAVDCSTKEIEGIYHASGSNDDGAYSGTVMISKTPKDGVYLLVWAWPNREQSSVRFITAAALRNGTSLSATWKVGEQVGLINYKIEPDGMTGKWIFLPNGADGVAEERLRFLSPFDVPST